MSRFLRGKIERVEVVLKPQPSVPWGDRYLAYPASSQTRIAAHMRRRHSGTRPLSRTWGIEIIKSVL